MASVDGVFRHPWWKSGTAGWDGDRVGVPTVLSSQPESDHSELSKLCRDASDGPSLLLSMRSDKRGFLSEWRGNCSSLVLLCSWDKRDDNTSCPLELRTACKSRVLVWLLSVASKLWNMVGTGLIPPALEVSELEDNGRLLVLGWFFSLVACVSFFSGGIWTTTL